MITNDKKVDLLNFHNKHFHPYTCGPCRSQQSPLKDEFILIPVIHMGMTLLWCKTCKGYQSPREDSWLLLEQLYDNPRTKAFYEKLFQSKEEYLASFVPWQGDIEKGVGQRVEKIEQGNFKDGRFTVRITFESGYVIYLYDVSGYAG